MMEVMYSEVEALFEGGLLEEASQMWGREVSLHEEKVDCTSTKYLPAALQSVEQPESCGFPLNVNYDLSGTCTESSEPHMNFYEDLLDAFDVNGQHFSTGIKVDHTQTFACKTSDNKLSGPSSPTESYDSGVASPGSVESYLSGSSEGTVQLNLHEGCLVSESGSSQDYELTEDFLNELGIHLLSEPIQETDIPEAAPISVQNISPSNKTFEESLHTIPTEDLLSFPIEANATSELSTLLSTPVSIESPVIRAQVIQQPVTIDIPTKPRSGRKSKITNAEEKKKRKREQNKNAAIRYRERKRNESDQKETEFSSLSDRNKELVDKVSQITREIDYLKELMIEVYTIKGLIS